MSNNDSLEPPRYQQAEYLKSALENKDLPPDAGIEVAFIGRSNAGKSSALNTLTGIKSLARTSNTPGRTQMLNFFTLDDDRRLVDLPGYGYAKVPASVKKRWEKHVNSYLTDRRCLAGLVVIADVRHPLKPMDEQVIAWAVSCELPVHVLLTKRDKLNNHQAAKSLQETHNLLKKQLGEGNFSIQLFSAVDRSGLDDLRGVVDRWLCPS
jgi:GTP-binding protein